MATLKLEIDLIYDEGLMHGDDDEAIEWFRNDILLGEGGRLILHSNEIGDIIGKVRVREIQMEEKRIMDSGFEIVAEIDRLLRIEDSDVDFEPCRRCGERAYENGLCWECLDG